MRFILTSFFLLPCMIMAQAKKPTLMILPSDNWCEQRYFMTEFDNQGTKQKVPNFKQAFQEDTEIGQVIAKIGSLMIERGFPLKDAEQELKAIEQRAAEDNMTGSTSGSGLAESPLDMLKNRAKADIILQIWWKVNKGEQGKSVSFTLEALDAYTSKRIAAASGTGAPNPTEIVPVLLQQAVLSNIDVFANQLQASFDDALVNGREIRLTVKRWANWDKDLETDIAGKEITDHIQDWLRANTVNGRFNITDASENIIRCEQARMPLFDSSGNALDARQFAKGLQKTLRGEPIKVPVKLMTRGLGEAILVLGEQ